VTKFCRDTVHYLNIDFDSKLATWELFNSKHVLTSHRLMDVENDKQNRLVENGLTWEAELSLYCVTLRAECLEQGWEGSRPLGISSHNWQ
jgi:hypothetical protein